MCGYIYIYVGFTGGQLGQLEDNTNIIEQREREIQGIVQSISQINEMYKDLATMIVEQVCVYGHEYMYMYAWYSQIQTDLTWEPSSVSYKAISS